MTLLHQESQLAAVVVPFGRCLLPDCSSSHPHDIFSMALPYSYAKDQHIAQCPPISRGIKNSSFFNLLRLTQEIEPEYTSSANRSSTYLLRKSEGFSVLFDLGRFFCISATYPWSIPLLEYNDILRTCNTYPELPIHNILPRSLPTWIFRHGSYRLSFCVIRTTPPHSPS